MRHVLGWIVVVGMFAATGYAAWCEVLIHMQDRRRERAQLDRFGRCDLTPRTPSPPIHFTRDPSPKPRRKEPAT